MQQLTFGSLFAGIGGIDLGLERAGLRCIWQVEIDDYARAVLEKHWPEVPKYRDVRFFLGSKKWRRERDAWRVDCIAGGFPCQDISNAGRRAGIDGKRSGLWSEFARIVRLLRPQYVVVENVDALAVRGMGRVLGDLAALGYDAEWDRIPAAAVGAPHLRWRIFILAYSAERGLQRRGSAERNDRSQSCERSSQSPGVCSGDVSSVADANGERCQEQHFPAEPSSAGLIDRSSLSNPIGNRIWLQGHGEAVSAAEEVSGEVRQQWLRSDSESAHCVGNNAMFEPYKDGSTEDGARADSLLSHSSLRWAGQCGRQQFAGYCQETRNLYWPKTQPPVCGVADGIPSRVDRLRGLGNAVLPQIAEWIGRRIVAYESAASA